MIYRSNWTCPDLTPYFRFLDPPMTRMDHDIPSDPDVDPNCGYLTHDEAAILYGIAKAWPGAWVDIGCRFGWSTAHIAAAPGVSGVVGLDPMLGDPAMMERCGLNRIPGSDARGPGMLLDQTSEEFFRSPRMIDGAHIDGCHDWPEPLLDAERAIRAGAKVIVWHDFLGAPVQRAVLEVGASGWKYDTYWTPNGMAVAWDPASGFMPPSHDRDRRVDWYPHIRQMFDLRLKWLAERERRGA